MSTSAQPESSADPRLTDPPLADPRLIDPRLADPPLAGPRRFWPTAGQYRRYRYRLIAIDAAAAVAGVILAGALRYGAPASVPTAIDWTALGLTLGWVLLLAANRGYDAIVMRTGLDEVRRAVGACVGLTLIVTLTSLLADLELDRGFVLIALGAILTLDLIARTTIRRRRRP
jgi:hypothetical protein